MKYASPCFTFCSLASCVLIFPLRCDFSNFFQTAAVLKGFVVSKKCQTTYNFRECHMRKWARIVSSYHTVQGSKLGDHTVSRSQLKG